MLGAGCEPQGTGFGMGELQGIGELGEPGMEAGGGGWNLRRMVGKWGFLPLGLSCCHLEQDRAAIGSDAS